ncbi:MAG: putative tricarboxylic transport membrane protein [Pseudohongiellaceae bacterium]|jgi:putative tricarboxylic transport membrane protein
MSLERALALFFLLVSLIYGYTAFFIIDAALPPYAKLGSVWPSSFPKIIALVGIFIAFCLIFSQSNNDEKSAISRETFRSYHLRPALILLSMMVAYALLLRPMGFVISTFSFLVLGAVVLGERKMILLMFIASTCAVGIWYLVQQVLGIYLRPWPWFLSGGF